MTLTGKPILAPVLVSICKHRFSVINEAIQYFAKIHLDITSCAWLIVFIIKVYFPSKYWKISVQNILEDIRSLLFDFHKNHYGAIKLVFLII